MPTRPGADQGRGNRVEQVQSHQEQDRRHQVRPPGTDIAQHAPRRRRGHADGGDGDEDTDGKETGDDEGAPGRHPPLAVDEADDEGNARQMAGGEEHAQDAPGEGSGQGQQRGAGDGVGQGDKERFHDGCPISC